MDEGLEHTRRHVQAAIDDAAPATRVPPGALVAIACTVQAPRVAARSKPPNNHAIYLRQ
jgi:hypothetical protein